MIFDATIHDRDAVSNGFYRRRFCSFADRFSERFEIVAENTEVALTARRCSFGHVSNTMLLYNPEALKRSSDVYA